MTIMSNLMSLPVSRELTRCNLIVGDVEMCGMVQYEAQGEYAAARAEQSAARRVAAQLRALLLELDALRRRVREPDRARFDTLTQRARDTTLRAIVDYLGTVPPTLHAPLYA